MRIAMVGPFGLNPNRTMSSRALPLAQALQRQGHELALFMPPWQTPEEADRQWEEAGVDLRYTRIGGQVPITVHNLTRDVLAWKPDIVHGFKPKAYSGLALWYFWQFYRSKITLLVDMDDWEGPGGWNDLAEYSAVQKRFFAWQERWGMAHAHALTIASRALQSIVWSNDIPADRVFYLPNGSGLPRSDPPVSTDKLQALRQNLGLHSRPTLLVYSRLFEFDVIRLAKVLKRVNDQLQDLAILMIGESLFAEDGQLLRQELDRAGLLPAIVNLGWVDEADLSQTLQLADAAIYLMDDTLINRCKCPVKLADLIASGLPVVAENVGQVSEYVVHGQHGYLRSTGDTTGLAADIVAILRNDRVRQEFSHHARQHYGTYFSWNVLAEKLAAIYQRFGAIT